MPFFAHRVRKGLSIGPQGRQFERGHGFESAAKALSVPRNTVRQWLYVYRSFGSEVLLSMDGKQTRYTYEQKVAAASAVVDGGMASRTP